MKTKNKLARRSPPPSYRIHGFSFFTPSGKEIPFPENLQKINGNPKLLRQKQIAYIWKFKDDLDSYLNSAK